MLVRLGKQELNLRSLRSERSDLARLVHSPKQYSRHDLNVQPPDSKSGALIQLSYESMFQVGAGRFERPISWAQARRAARLRHTPLRSVSVSQASLDLAASRLKGACSTR